MAVDAQTLLIINTRMDPCAQTSCRIFPRRESVAEGEPKAGGQRGLLGFRRRGQVGMRVGVPVHRIHVETVGGVCEEDKEGMNVIRGDIARSSPWRHLPQSESAQRQGASIVNLCSTSN